MPNGSKIGNGDFWAMSCGVGSGWRPPTSRPATPIWTRETRSRQNCSDPRDRKSTRLNSSHLGNSYAVFCFKKKRQAPKVAFKARHRVFLAVRVIDPAFEEQSAGPNRLGIFRQKRSLLRRKRRGQHNDDTRR